MHHHNKENFERICELVMNVYKNGDSIVQTMRIKAISEEFIRIIADEKALGYVKNETISLILCQFRV